MNNRKILAICDTESRYCGRLDEYLRENLNLSFDIHSFTRVDILEDFAGENQVSLLVIAESAVAELKKRVRDLGIFNVLILDEELSLVREDETGENSELSDVNSEHISKYKPASEIVYHILDYCAKRSDEFAGVGVKTKDSKGTVIGFFSPISGCGQTALCVKTCEELANRGKTLLLNFDSFSPLPMLFGHETEGDITDILYYAECERNKFCLYLEKIKQTYSGFDYVAPAGTTMQIKEIDFEKLKNLINLICNECGYEYVVLDLSDLPDGLFDILRFCDKVITITGNARTDRYKLMRYEDVLRQNGYEDICAAEVKVTIPEGAGDRELAACARRLLALGEAAGGE